MPYFADVLQRSWAAVVFGLRNIFVSVARQAARRFPAEVKGADVTELAHKKGADSPLLRGADAKLPQGRAT